jgi:alpha-glucosidase
MSGDWWRGAVIYQIYPRSFYDSSGDGIGDLRGIVEKLPYIASLGVDGLWLSPVFASPMADFGYDVSDYRQIDPLFGRLEDLDELVRRAHEHGLKLLLDMVWGHSSDRHPWFVESRSSRSGPRESWYVWADPRADGTPPNNWLSVFGGGAWRWEPRRRQYYLHHFLPSQPKLNLRNPAVMAALLEVGEFWLARGVDGFRLDAVDFLVHDAALRDNPAATHVRDPAKPYHMQEHLHDLGGPEILPVIEQIRRFTDRFPGSVVIAEVGGETTDTTSLARAASYVGGAGRRLHAAYSLAQMKAGGNAAAMRDAIRESEGAFPQDGHFWAFSNHDVTRVASRWGDGSAAAARLFLSLLLSLRGGVFLYQGEELGLPEAEVPFDRLQDPYGRNYWPDFKGRDGCRTPMPWTSAGANAGFSRASATWLPIPEEHRRLAVDLQEGDPHSLLQTCRHLLHRRKIHASLRHGALILQDAPEPIVAFERRAGEESILCVFNLSGEAAEFQPEASALKPLAGAEAATDGASVRLPPYGTYFARKEQAREPRVVASRG